ncbi:tetratricopeptide repeat domain protein [Burkholderia pseudomallei MSHR332]|nr:tetratricopeptide repeat domain protein [Burkholderia pseudomallei MSHR332]
MTAELDARVRALTLRAQQLFDDSRPEQGALLAAQALALAPDDALALKLVGVAECMRGDHARGSCISSGRACRRPGTRICTTTWPSRTNAPARTSARR